MKKILMLMFAVITAMTMNAQQRCYKSTAFYSSVRNAYGWSNWEGPQRSDLLIIIDWTEGYVYVKSPSEQFYKITQVIGNYTDSDGDKVIETYMIDQDGDRGGLKLMVRRNGQSQIYITFNDVRWCYDVRKY